MIELQDPRAIDRLKALLQDEDRRVRRYAAFALVESGDDSPEVRKAVVDWIKSAEYDSYGEQFIDFDITFQCFAHLRKGPRGVLPKLLSKDLVDIINDPLQSNRRIAVEFYNYYHGSGESVLDALIKMLADIKGNNRIQNDIFCIMSLIANAGDKGRNAIPTLQMLMDSDDKFISNMATVALLSIDVKHAKADAKLKADIKSGPRNYFMPMFTVVSARDSTREVYLQILLEMAESQECDSATRHSILFILPILFGESLKKHKAALNKMLTGQSLEIQSDAILAHAPTDAAGWTESEAAVKRILDNEAKYFNYRLCEQLLKADSLPKSIIDMAKNRYESINEESSCSLAACAIKFANDERAVEFLRSKMKATPRNDSREEIENNNGRRMRAAASVYYMKETGKVFRNDLIVLLNDKHWGAVEEAARSLAAMDNLKWNKP